MRNFLPFQFRAFVAYSLIVVCSCGGTVSPDTTRATLTACVATVSVAAAARRLDAPSSADIAVDFATVAACVLAVASYAAEASQTACAPDSGARSE